MSRLFLLLVLIIPQIRAAHIDLDYTGIQGTALAEILQGVLTVPVAEGMAADQPLLFCTRILVAWEGVDMAPLVRFRGVPGSTRMEVLAAAGMERVETPFGVGYRLPSLLGYIAITTDRDEILAGAPEVILGLTEIPPFPAEFTQIMSFVGLAGDLKLGDISDNLVDINFAWPHDGKLNLTSTAKSTGDAKAVLRYIAVRKPLVQMAAGLGVDKADFPSRLLGATKWDRDGKIILATFNLDDPTRIEAVDYLTKSLRRQLRKYRKIKDAPKVVQPETPPGAE